MFKEYTMEEANKVILSGKDFSVGSNEKTRSKTVFHIELTYTCGNYRLFYEGTEKTLRKALQAIEKINDPETDKKTIDFCYYTLVDCLWFVEHKSTKKQQSKLDGITSISTCCKDNFYCLSRIASGDSICAKCYANAQQARELSLQDHNIINGIILRNVIIPTKYWKKIKNLPAYIRIESFGDVQNVTQATNYINFCNAFSRKHFAVWSKNIGVWTLAFLKNNKPENLTYVHSSNKINVPETYVLAEHDWIDHLFTVYDKNQNVKITCGGRRCMDCINKKRGCYFKTENKIENERLK